MKRTLPFILLSLFSIIGHAASQIVVISGGDDPGLNHYSQYLQTKTLYNFLVKKYGQERVGLYFGAGNNEQHQPLPLDVHKKINTKEDKNTKQDEMLTGVIPGNQMASKALVSAYFLSPKIQSLTPNDNLFIFVSDHGMPYAFFDDKSDSPFRNNCIDLWHYSKPFINNFTNPNDFNQACLTKNELSSLLAQVPAKHIVFIMSQCYSGGFHQLSVKRKDGYPSANPKICGFTAVPADHFASGCTADADGATYQGYERSFTENYTGMSILTGEAKGEPAKDIPLAHKLAVLDDITVDVPISTADYYLMMWAEYFMKEQFNSRIDGFKPHAIQNIFNHYQAQLKSINNPDLTNFVQLTEANVTKINAVLPEAKDFSEQTLESQGKKIASLEQQIKEQGDELELTWEGMMNLNSNIINPQWSNAFKQQLNAKNQQFEQAFYQRVIEQGMYKHPYQLDMYYLQYLSAMNNDKDLVTYHKNRINIIEQWAKDKQDSTLVNAIVYYQTLDKKQQQLQDQIAEMEKNKQLLKRIYTYQQIIAAWVTLIKINDKTALADLRGLLECQHTELS